MRTQIALSNLSHNRVRTALSTAGVCFAIVLIFMQLGFLGAVMSTATLIYDKLEFDVVIRSTDYLHICDARQIRRDTLAVVEALPEVKRATPFHIMLNNWLNPYNGEARGIVVMAAPLDQNPIQVAEVQSQLDLLTADQYLLIDRKTRSDYGPRVGKKFGDADRGATTELAGSQVKIVGHFEMGTGLAANGAVVTSEAGFDRVSRYDVRTHATLGLITLKPGVDPEAFVRSLQPLLADGAAEALTRREVDRRELKRWVYDTPIGAIFQMGVFLAFVVGAAIVYMVLSTDVANHLPEYATLNAMGYSQNFLSRVIMQQALALAVLAYLPAWAVSLALYGLTAWLANIPIAMNSQRLAMVFALSLAMSVVSGVLALRKLRKADPAELF